MRYILLSFSLLISLSLLVTGCGRTPSPKRDQGGGNSRCSAAHPYSIDGCRFQPVAEQQSDSDHFAYSY